MRRAGAGIRNRPAAQALNYPINPVRVITLWPAGGLTDVAGPHAYNALLSLACAKLPLITATQGIHA